MQWPRKLRCLVLSVAMAASYEMRAPVFPRNCCCAALFIWQTAVYFTFTVGTSGTVSTSSSDLTISVVPFLYFRKWGVSKWAW